MRPDQQLDCHARVVTPENIAFEYALAGPFQRLPAFLFDFILRGLIFLGLVFISFFMLAMFSLPGGVAALIMLTLAFFFMSWFYGVLFETRFNGRTPGKMLFRLRAISTDGRPINASQALLRNMLRLADMCVPVMSLFGAPTMSVGLICMTFSNRFQRIGDLAAGTMVVTERSRNNPWNLLPDDVRAFGLAEMIPANFQVSSSLATTLGLYMENRKRLSAARRDDIARHIADILIEKFDLLPDTGPDLLLCALYTRVFMSESQREDGLQRCRGNLPLGASVPGGR